MNEINVCKILQLAPSILVKETSKYKQIIAIIYALCKGFLEELIFDLGAEG